jgi:hypothetical protein
MFQHVFFISEQRMAMAEGWVDQDERWGDGSSFSNLVDMETGDEKAFCWLYS